MPVSLNVTRLNVGVEAYNTLYIELINKTAKVTVGVLYSPPKQSEENDNKEAIILDSNYTSVN